MACDLMVKQMLIKLLWLCEWANLRISSGFLVNRFHQFIKTAVNKVIFKKKMLYACCKV